MCRAGEGELLVLENSAGWEVELSVPAGVGPGDEFEAVVLAGAQRPASTGEAESAESAESAEEFEEAGDRGGSGESQFEEEEGGGLGWRGGGLGSEAEEEDEVLPPGMLVRSATLVASASASLIAAKDAEIDRLKLELEQQRIGAL